MSEWQQYNQPWSYEKVALLVNGEYLRRYENNGREHTHEVTSDGYYGARLRAIDHGDFDSVLDCIQLDQAIQEHVADSKVAAALTLRMAGWHPAAIGPVLRTHRPATKLINEGILAVHAGERRKAYERKAAHADR